MSFNACDCCPYSKQSSSQAIFCLNMQSEQQPKDKRGTPSLKSFLKNAGSSILQQRLSEVQKKMVQR
jgi:hypothetical protein